MLKLAEIPPEFKKSNYDICKTWGINQWLDALITRQSALRTWQYSSNHNDKTAQEVLAAISRAREIALKLIKNPTEKTYVGADFYPEEPPTSIRNQNLLDYFDCWQKMAKNRVCPYGNYGRIAAYGKEDRPEDNVQDRFIRSQLSTDAWRFNDQWDESPREFFIAVSLDETDDVVIDEFKSWLKKIRKDTERVPLSRPINLEDLDEWFQRYLPFLDLTLWAKTHDRRISGRLLGKAIFGDLQGVADRLRTVEKNANDIISDESIQKLRAQAVAAELKKARDNFKVPPN